MLIYITINQEDILLSQLQLLFTNVKHTLKVNQSNMKDTFVNQVLNLYPVCQNLTTRDQLFSQLRDKLAWVAQSKTEILLYLHK